MERKLIGVISTSGKQGPMGPVGPIGPVGPRGPAGETQAYSSISKLDDYLYNVHYLDTDDEFAKKYFKDKQPTPNVAGCSSFVKDGKFCRLFDWIYDNTVEFRVKTPARDGRHAVTGIANGPLKKDVVESGDYSELYKIVPYYIVDGQNSAGLTISTNVVPLDNEPTVKTTAQVEERAEICSIMLPRWLLDRCATAYDAVTYARDYLSIYVPKALQDMHYEQHFLIADRNNSYVLELIDNQVWFEECDAITNFYIYGTDIESTVLTPETGKPSTQGITPHGSGLERYNLIKTHVGDVEDLVESLLYTHSYKRSTNPFWYSEFVDGDLTVDSDVSEFTDIVNRAIYQYEHRTREDEIPTWQSVHAIIYDLNDLSFKIKVQEKGWIAQTFETITDSVISFNGRKGEVLPEIGDYNLHMVGAEMLTNTDIDDLWNNL